MAFSEPSAGYGHNWSDKEASWGNFTVTKSNPSGMTVRFTVTDTVGLLTTMKMLRAVLADAIDTWIAAERSDLDSNGDSAVKGSSELEGIGDGFSEFSWDKNGKYAEVTLTALTNISTSGTITVSKAYADVV